jgi:hypothetical protein
MIGNGYRNPRIIPVGEEPPPFDSRPPKPRKPTPGKASEPKGSAHKRKAAGRFRVLNSFVDFTLAELSRAEIAVWLILYRDTRDGEAQTAMADLARRAGCVKRSVARAVQRLEALGLLKVVRRGAFRRGASVYCCHPLANVR